MTKYKKRDLKNQMARLTNINKNGVRENSNSMDIITDYLWNFFETLIGEKLNLFGKKYIK